jgi:hypothetical protein
MSWMMRYLAIAGLACCSTRASDAREGQTPPCAPCPVCPSADAAPSVPVAVAGAVTSPSVEIGASIPAPTLTLTPITCSYGGVGPAAPPGTTAAEVPDVWVIAMVNVRAEGEVRGIRLESLEMLDASGHVAGRAQLPGELRVVPQDRPLQDLSAYDTEPFGGTVAAGATMRLWIHAALDVRWAALGQPVRYRAEFVAEGGRRFAVEGDVGGPWPTG